MEEKTYKFHISVCEDYSVQATNEIEARQNALRLFYRDLDDGNIETEIELDAVV